MLQTKDQASVPLVLFSSFVNFERIQERDARREHRLGHKLGLSHYF
jgi:hypothetical protein